MNKKDLLKLKEEITEANEEVIGLNARIKVLMEQLKKEWNCDSLDAAHSKIGEMEEELVTLNEQIIIKMEVLEGQLNERPEK